MTGAAHSWPLEFEAMHMRPASHKDKRRHAGFAHGTTGHTCRNDDASSDLCTSFHRSDACCKVCGDFKPAPSLGEDAAEPFRQPVVLLVGYVSRALTA